MPGTDDLRDRMNPLNVFILKQFKDELESKNPDTERLRIFGKYLHLLNWTRTSIDKISIPNAK